MERCLDCNCVLSAKEKVCPLCGTTLRKGRLGIGELAARGGTLIFYGAILALIASRFTENPALPVVLGITSSILLFVMWKKTRS